MKINSDPHTLKISRWLMKVGFAFLILGTAAIIYGYLTQQQSITSIFSSGLVLVFGYSSLGVLYFIIRKREKQQSE